jgi:hypothetical protein
LKHRAFYAAALLLVSALLLEVPPSAMADGRSSISGIVYFDANANGQPEPHERAVRNFQVDLDGPDYHESQKTDDHGKYEFANLAPGKYWISVKLPNGFGLSAGENRELVVDGRNSLERVDFGIARSEQLPTPTVAPTRAPPTATRAPAVSAPPPAAPYAPPPSGAAPRTVAPPVARQAPPPPPTRTPEPTATPRPSATPEASPTATPTPTRTPPPVDELQAGAERARAALGWPGAPRMGSINDAGNVLLDVPFRTALDGSDYSDTNSGTAALAMAMEAYGFKVETADLRALANVLSRTHDVGQAPRLDLLVRVAEQAGLRGIGVYQGVRLTVWTADDVRERLRAGYPVLTQIGSAESYVEAGDEQRYVLVIGFREGAFVYHDPTYPDDRGVRRSLPASSLTRAWSRAASSAQGAGLALGRAQLGLFASLEDLLAAQQQPDTFANVLEVPTASPQSAQTSQSQLRALQEVEADEADELPSQSPSPWGIPLTHPLLLAFWALAGVAFVKVAAGLFFG